MLIAYFDESGNENDQHGTFTVAGSISTVQKWSRFEAQWKEILGRYGVEIFHMQECAQGTGEYGGWSGDRRRAFITDLSECMARHIKHAFAVTVLLEGWQHINEEFALSRHFGHPYAFCGRLCAFCVRSWMRRKKLSVPVAYVFENGAKHRGELMTLMDKHDGITPDFKPKTLAPLQAADLIAWKNRRLVRDLVKYPYSLTREQFQSSLAPIARAPRKFWVLDERELLDFCGRHKVPSCLFPS